MKTNHVFNAIAGLDLTPIKTKLMHRASGEGWSAAKADAIELEYRRFLYLMHAFPAEEMAPTVDVDTFWHYHILDTMKYAADCEQVFGYFMHHYPYEGLETAPDAGAEERGGKRMQELYEQTFGEQYIREEAYGSAMANAAYCLYRPTDKAGSADTVSAGAGSNTADCPTQASQAAYCLRRPDMHAGSDAAYCLYRPTVKAGSDAAYCLYRPTVNAGSDAAYCLYRPTLDDGNTRTPPPSMMRQGRAVSPIVPA